jgi:preprotein translocase subunit SecD
VAEESGRAEDASQGARACRNNAVEQALQVLRNRIDQFGVAEPTIQAQGDDDRRAAASVRDPQRARTIGRTALLSSAWWRPKGPTSTPGIPVRAST